MGSKTKIVVLHKKEVFYAGILTAAGFLLLFLFLIFLFPKGNDAGEGTAGADAASADMGRTAADSLNANNSTVLGVNAPQEVVSRAGVLQENLPTHTYIPGVYKTELLLGGQSIEVEAVLEKDRIASIRLVDLDETVATMYPLLTPTMERLSSQIYETQSLEHLETENSAKYTSLVLLEAIRCCLEKGTP